MNTTLNITVTLPRDLAETITTLLQGHLAPVSPDTLGEYDVACPWQSPDLPEGYQTVVGRMAERDLLDGGSLIIPTAQSTQRDGFWCKARVPPYKIIKVEAPEKLQDMGLTLINAYPTSVVDDRIDLVLARLELEENPFHAGAIRSHTKMEESLKRKYLR